MEKLRLRPALGAGWNSFTKRPLYLLGLMLAVVAVTAFVIGDALATALSSIIYGGYLALLIRHYRGEHVVFDDLFITDARWVNFAFLSVIKTLLIALGLLCFIAPGVYLAVRWMFADLYVIEEGKRPIEALRASYALTQGYWWRLFLFGLVVIVLVMIGLLFLVVGALVAGVVAAIATIKLFDDLRGIQWRRAHPNG